MRGGPTNKKLPTTLYGNLKKTLLSVSLVDLIFLPTIIDWFTLFSDGIFPAGCFCDSCTYFFKPDFNIRLTSRDRVLGRCSGFQKQHSINNWRLKKEDLVKYLIEGKVEGKRGRAFNLINFNKVTATLHKKVIEKLFQKS